MGKPKPKEAAMGHPPQEDTEEEVPLALKATLDKILQAITETKETLQAQIGTVTTELSLLRADHRKLTEKVTTVEGEVTELKPVQQQLQAQMSSLTTRVQTLEKRAEDAEGRSRRNNVRIVGLPEKTEGGDTVKYLENWMQTQVAPGELSQFFALERAHRVPTQAPLPGRPPRPIVAKLLFFKDRDLLLQKARENGPYLIENAKVTMFPDFTLAVQNKRGTFLEVKREMRNMGLTYALIFPAKLRVAHDGKVNVFMNPTEAWDWLESYKREGGPLPRRKRGLPEQRESRRPPARQVVKTGGPSQNQTREAQRAAVQKTQELTNTEWMGSESIANSESNTESDGTENSTHSQSTAPKVTPQTADDFI